MVSIPGFLPEVFVEERGIYAKIVGRPPEDWEFYGVSVVGSGKGVDLDGEVLFLGGFEDKPCRGAWSVSKLTNNFVLSVVEAPIYLCWIVSSALMGREIEGFFGKL